MEIKPTAIQMKRLGTYSTITVITFNVIKTREILIKDLPKWKYWGFRTATDQEIGDWLDE